MSRSRGCGARLQSQASSSDHADVASLGTQTPVYVTFPEVTEEVEEVAQAILKDDLEHELNTGQAPGQMQSQAPCQTQGQASSLDQVDFASLGT